jgi:hypothetical protein
VRSDRAVSVPVEAGEFLAEADHILQAGHQHLAQGHPADRLLALHRIVLEWDLKREHLVELLIEHVEPSRCPGTGGDEGVVQVWRQQGMQRAAAVGIDANAIAVEPVGPQCVAFEYAHVDSRSHQAMGEREPAGSGADYKHAW